MSGDFNEKAVISDGVFKVGTTNFDDIGLSRIDQVEKCYKLTM